MCGFPVHFNVQTPVFFGVYGKVKKKLLFLTSSHVNLMLLSTELMCSVKVCLMGLSLTHLSSIYLKIWTSPVPLKENQGSAFHFFNLEVGHNGRYW